MTRNKMSRSTYLWAFYCLYLIFGAYFRVVLFVPLISFVSHTTLSVRESMTILLLLSLASLGIGVLVTFKRNRNYFHLFIGIFFPFCLYLILEMYPAVPKWILVYWCCCLLCVLFCGVCIARRPIAEGANKKRIIKARCKRFGHSLYMITGFFSLVLVAVFMAADLFDVSLGGLGRYAAYNLQREADAAVYMYEEELALLHEDQWQSAGQDEKRQCLETVIQIETAYLGLSHEVSLRINKIDGSALGYYNSFYQEITIDADHVNEDSARKCLETILHEMYHGYQYDLCEVYDAVSEKYRNLLDLRKASNYIYEFVKHESGEEDYFKYASQESETDAREYARERAEMYIAFRDITA